jgi:hypothetical protein
MTYPHQLFPRPGHMACGIPGGKTAYEAMDFIKQAAQILCLWQSAHSMPTKRKPGETESGWVRLVSE